MVIWIIELEDGGFDRGSTWFPAGMVLALRVFEASKLGAMSGWLLER